MIKKLRLLSLLTLFIFLTGCENFFSYTTTTTSTETITDNRHLVIDEEYDSIVQELPYALTENFQLPTPTNPLVSVQYSVNNNPVVNNIIPFQKLAYDFELKLSILLSYENLEVEKEFIIIQIRDEGLYNQAQIDLVFESIYSTLQDIFPKTIASDFTLPTIEEESVKIEYSVSKNYRIFNNRFLFTFPEEQTSVDINAKITYQKQTKTYPISVTMLAFNELPKIPELHITTTNNAPVTSKDVYVSARLTLKMFDENLAESTPISNASMQIRTRGATRSELSDSLFECSNVDKNILKSGPILLRLIESLDENKKDDIPGLLLLRKLNRYLYLEFRHFIGQLDIAKTDQARMIGFLHEFYKFKVLAPTGFAEAKLKYVYPFQATISKAMLFILIVNASSELDYDEKIENVAYFLDKIRRELMTIKNSNVGFNLNAEDINGFIKLLQSFATGKPFINPNFVKWALITAIVIAVIVVVVWLAWTKVVLPTLVEKADHAMGALVCAKESLKNEIKEELQHAVDHATHMAQQTEGHVNEIVDGKLRMASNMFDEKLNLLFDVKLEAILESIRERSGYMGRSLFGEPKEKPSTMAQASEPEAAVVPRDESPSSAADDAGGGWFNIFG